MGILAYLKRNGLENESSKAGSKQVLFQFHKNTRVHPYLVPEPEEVVIDVALGQKGTAQNKTPEEGPYEHGGSRSCNESVISQAKNSSADLNKTSDACSKPKSQLNSNAVLG